MSEAVKALTPAELARYDASYWAVLHKIRLQGSVFELWPHHAYQQEPMSSDARRVCYMKATGGGFSELEILKSLHGMIHDRYPLGVLYLFPTTDDVGEFSKSRFGPLIAANPMSIGRYVKAGGKGTDTTSLKKVGEANLFLRGARLTQMIEGGTDAKEASKLRGIQVNRVVFDELDLMDEDAIAKGLGRSRSTAVQEEVYISNPTAEGVGIDKIFARSDQRYWFRRCVCGHWFSADEAFPDCVRMGESNGKGYIGCPKCGKAVPPFAGVGTGQWVAKKPEVKDMVGYHWSHLSSWYNDPMDVLNEVNDPNNPNLSDTYHLRLGLPFTPKEARLSVGQVYDCCGPEQMLQRYAGPCAMGVDIGREFHVVIGIRTGPDRYESLRFARIPCSASLVTMDSAWAAVHDLARAFNVKSAVVDIRPYEHEARAFRKAEPYRLRLCEYTENALTDNVVNDETGVVKSYRTGLCDTTHKLVADGRLKIPRRCPEVELFAKHVSSMAKVLEKNKKTGVSVYRYIGPDDDHYRHALGYFWLAAQSIGISRGTGRRVVGKPKTEYAII
ncbi:MAG: phage terminase large subunit family protein [Candidatus Atribacteria bacterium]|nr:phage terminase large subunit family protein [Candidatus Atribacteria bacterium]